MRRLLAVMTTRKREFLPASRVLKRDQTRIVKSPTALTTLIVIGSISSLTDQFITFRYLAWRSLISSDEHAWRWAQTPPPACEGSALMVLRYG
jgi:hypothetical protein